MGLFSRNSKGFFDIRKKYEFRSAPIVDCWHGEARDAGYSMWLQWILDFYWSRSWKQGQNSGKLLVINKVLAILGQLMQRLYVKDLLPYLVWPFSGCISSLILNCLLIFSYLWRVLRTLYQNCLRSLLM